MHYIQEENGKYHYPAITWKEEIQKKYHFSFPLGRGGGVVCIPDVPIGKPLNTWVPH